MATKGQIFISQIEAPFLATLNKHAKTAVFDLLVAYAIYRQRVIVQPGEDSIKLFNCCSPEVSSVMLQHYLRRMAAIEKDSLARFKASLAAEEEAEEGASDEDDDSDDDSQLVSFGREIVNPEEATAEHSSARASFSFTLDSPAPTVLPRAKHRDCPSSSTCAPGRLPRAPRREVEERDTHRRGTRG